MSTSIPNFADVSRATEKAATTSAEEAKGTWTVPEGFDVKRVYNGEDREHVLKAGHPLDSYPGIKPFMCGPYPTMYTNRPWTIRQYAGFSTAAESNAFYRRNLAAGHVSSSRRSDRTATTADRKSLRPLMLT